MFSRKPGDKEASGHPFACFCQKSEIEFLNNRISADLSRRGFVAGMAASMLMLVLPKLASAQTAPPPVNPAHPILFTNFRLFDGISGTLRDRLYLLVDGNRIHSLTQGKPAVPDGTQVIDCGGRVLMPGLIDMHWHAMIAALPIQVLLSADVGYIHLAASAEAERTLMRGFTTVRDAGGPAFALKQAIDEGLISGPRIYPSGAMITTSGGHGDFRSLADLPRSGGRITSSEQTGGSIIADNADEVRLRVREQFMQGASQIKLVGSGGVSTPRSPLDMLTFTESQLRAAVETAEDWGSYVLVHAYESHAIHRSLAAGVKCIEHGHLMDDATASLMAKNGTWLSTQPFVSEDDFVPLTGSSRDKMLQVFAGTNTAYTLAKKHGIKTAFGSDLLFSPVLARRQGAMLTHLVRWYTPAETLKMATATNGQLLALSGPRNPYPGKLGVVEEGAFADLLLVDGNPVENIELVADPEKNFLIIMKDGKIYKNALNA
ncbi:imidazolonepropionase-like amidohydrolase [Paraburkholderia sp. GAS448]|uniref:metal-dependent hydrolase family protein n=1 Tax=Paraburkholderia sp. GAS448 TaxID=3035136 RepID=UPI003D2546C5